MTPEDSIKYFIKIVMLVLQGSTLTKQMLNFVKAFKKTTHPDASSGFAVAVNKYFVNELGYKPTWTNKTTKVLINLTDKMIRYHKALKNKSFDTRSEFHTWLKTHSCDVVVVNICYIASDGAQRNTHAHLPRSMWELIEGANVPSDINIAEFRKFVLSYISRAIGEIYSETFKVKKTKVNIEWIDLVVRSVKTGRAARTTMVIEIDRVLEAFPLIEPRMPQRFTFKAVANNDDDPDATVTDENMVVDKGHSVDKKTPSSVVWSEVIPSDVGRFEDGVYYEDGSDGVGSSGASSIPPLELTDGMRDDHVMRDVGGLVTDGDDVTDDGATSDGSDLSTVD